MINAHGVLDVDLKGDAPSFCSELSHLSNSLQYIPTEVLLNEKQHDISLSFERKPEKSLSFLDPFATRSDRGAPVRIPASWVPRVMAWANDDLAVLRSTAAIIVGSESDLVVDPSTAAESDAVRADDVARAAGAALAYLAGAGT